MRGSNAGDHADNEQDIDPSRTSSGGRLRDCCALLARWGVYAGIGTVNFLEVIRLFHVAA